MMEIAPCEILTPRIRLRRLHEDDFPAFAAMNGDAEVMRYFPELWTVEKSRAAFQTINTGFAKRGFGVYAAEVSSEFAGIVGLSTPSFRSWFTPCVEILWRLRAQFWGKGLATEAAQAVLGMAGKSLSIDEVFAFAVPQNLKSVRVIEKVGMKPCTPQRFEHPEVQDRKLKPHLLFSVKLRSAESLENTGKVDLSVS